MVKETLMDVGSVGLGALGGAFVAQFGSNKISDALVKDEVKAADEISFYKKAYFWDVVIGATVAALGVWAIKNKNARLAAFGGAGYLLANGIKDGVIDYTAELADRSKTGRPKAASLSYARAYSRTFTGRPMATCARANVLGTPDYTGVTIL